MTERADGKHPDALVLYGDGIRHADPSHLATLEKIFHRMDISMVPLPDFIEANDESIDRTEGTLLEIRAFQEFAASRGRDEADGSRLFSLMVRTHVVHRELKRLFHETHYEGFRSGIDSTRWAANLRIDRYPRLIDHPSPDWYLNTRDPRRRIWVKDREVPLSRLDQDSFLDVFWDYKDANRNPRDHIDGMGPRTGSLFEEFAQELTTVEYLASRGKN